MYPYMISGAYAIVISAILYGFDLYSCGKSRASSRDGYMTIHNQIADNEKPSCSRSSNETFVDSDELTRCDKKLDDEKSALLKHNKNDHNESSSLLNSADFQANSTLRPNFTLIKVLSVLFVNLFIGKFMI